MCHRVYSWHFSFLSTAHVDGRFFPIQLFSCRSALKSAPCLASFLWLMAGKKTSLFSFKSSTYTRGRVTTTWNFAAVIWPASYVKFYFLFYPIYTTFLSLRLGGRFEHCQADLLMSSAEKCGPTHDRKEKERRPGCWRVLSFVCYLRHHFACPPPLLCWSDWGQRNEVGRWAKLFFLAGFDRNTENLQKKVHQK